MSLNCNAEFFDISHYIKAMIGVEDGKPAFRFMQVESVGDYFDCVTDKDIDTPEALFRLLIDTNVCEYPVLRVDITTDLGDCVNFQDCNQKEMTAFEALKHVIGIGADGHPVFRIMLSSALS